MDRFIASMRTPAQMAEIVRDLGFVDVIHSERDLAWSFAVVGAA